MDGDGSSWAHAMGDLQAALDRAAALPYVREVWVAAGNYIGGFVVPDGVRVYGGFARGDTTRGQRRPRTNETVLNGGFAQRVVELGDGSVLDGFTVRNGRAAGVGGGGALVEGTSPRIRNCLFTANANQGGRGSALLVRSGGRPIVESTIFTGNGQPGAGHVVDVDSAGGRYENIAIWDNHSNGFHMQFGSDPIVRNSIFGLNTGRGICQIHSNDAPLIDNNLFWNNGVSLMHLTGGELHSIAQINALSYASDNLSADPLFIDVDAFDYRPGAGSPCIDAGFAATFPALAVDARGTPRVLDGDLNGQARVDIGPQELDHVELGLLARVGRDGSLSFSAAGTGGLSYQLWLGREAPASEDPPYGVQLFQLSGASTLDAGTLPATGSVSIPAGYASGDVLVLQALALNGGGTAGNWSNAVRVVVP